MSNKIKVVVTGGAGFIGSNLTDALIERGFDVHVIDNLSSGKKENLNPQASLNVIDITDLEAIQPVFKDAKYVFHLAAFPSVQYSIEHPDETHTINVNGTMNVLIAAQKAGVKKVIYSASSAAYGDQEKMPLTEDMAANPKSPYGLQKYICELYCKVWTDVYGLPTVSLRYFNVYGPRQNAEGAYPNVISKFMKLKSEGQPLTVTGDGTSTRDFINVKDVALANILAMESDTVGKGECINIGSGRNESVNKIAELIGGPVVNIPARFEPKNSLADNSKAKKLLGWEPKISLEQGISELKAIMGLK